MESVEELGFIIAVEVVEAQEFDGPGSNIERIRVYFARWRGDLGWDWSWVEIELREVGFGKAGMRFWSLRKIVCRNPHHLHQR
jgi:hypothetical protein